MCDVASRQGGEALDVRRMRLLGLCARAGKLLFGTPIVCEALGSGKVLLALMASGASDNTKKRIRDKCRYYGVTLLELSVSTEELAHTVGKSGDVAVVGVTDRHFADGLSASEK